MKKIILVFVMLIAFLTLSLKCYAFNSGFSTTERTAEENKSFVDNIEFKLLTEEPQKKEISCFDVNPYGDFAVCNNSTTYKNICVYSKDGSFLYGYQLKAEGSIGLEWNKRYLNIYFVRGGVIIKVNSHGEILDVADVEDTIENNDYYCHNIDSNKKLVGKKTYALKNDMGILNSFASAYSKLTITDAHGTETVVYDIGSDYQLKLSSGLVGAGAFVAVVATVVVYKFLKLRKENQSD